MPARKRTKGKQIMKTTMKETSIPFKKRKIPQIQPDILRDFVRPLFAASFIVLSMTASLGGGTTNTTIFFMMFIFTTQMVPWLAFRSYVANNNSFDSPKQRISLLIGWFLIYVIAGNILLYNAPHGVIKCFYETENIFQTYIAGITLNHNIRILAILFYDDWFAAKGITTPTQAMFAFNASMVIKYRKKQKDTKSIWKEKITELVKILAITAIDVILLKIGAHLYKEYRQYIDPKPILYYELSAIYTAINVDFMVNRVGWLNVLIYGGEMDFEYAMKTPVLSRSPRDFWKRESIQQREALNLGIFKPIMKSTGNYWLAILAVFFGNFVVHVTFTAQVTFEYFAIYEWGMIFVVMFVVVGMELFTEKVLLKKTKMEHIKANIFYKAFWFIVLHISMAIVVYFGVPKLVALGLESSYYFIENSW